jgi:hypothetical protein
VAGDATFLDAYLFVVTPTSHHAFVVFQGPIGTRIVPDLADKASDSAPRAEADLQVHLILT